MVAAQGKTRYHKNSIERACFWKRRTRQSFSLRPDFGYEGDWRMLPCQGNCPDYQTGCHKQCQRWREYQQLQQVQRAKKTTYLRFYRELCGTITRQLRADSARYPMW